VFERFTERACQVVVLAQEEARRVQHNYIGAEHILLGLLREEEGLAARVLESLDITIEDARAQVVEIVGSGEEVTSGQIPFTPRGKKVLELALREAERLGHSHIGTEHILLGVVRENDGVVARILLHFGAEAETVSNELMRMLSGPDARARIERTPVGEHGPGAVDGRWVGGLGPVLRRLSVEIRDELGREPDDGDLLLALACAPDTLAGQTLRQLGVERDVVWASLEQLRRQASGAREELRQRIEEARTAKEKAIEGQDFQTAARLRDQERELEQQARAVNVVKRDVLSAIRRHLGIPSPPDQAPQSQSES
jgi:ATP-dependent Clp protease ATP-binding subunit ClpA